MWIPLHSASVQVIFKHDQEHTIEIENSSSSPLHRSEFTCLTVVLDALERRDRMFARLRPRLFAKCLRVLVTLAAHPLTEDATLSMLAPDNVGPLLATLAGLLAAPMPQPEGNVHARAAVLRQRAYVLQLATLVLLRSQEQGGTEMLLQV